MLTTIVQVTKYKLYNHSLSTTIAQVIKYKLYNHSLSTTIAQVIKYKILLHQICNEIGTLTTQAMWTVLMNSYHFNSSLHICKFQCGYNINYTYMYIHTSLCTCPIICPCTYAHVSISNYVYMYINKPIQKGSDPVHSMLSRHVLCSFPSKTYPGKQL